MFEQTQVGYFESKDDIYEHMLTISNISVNDAGEYKCQLVNSNPKLEQVISNYLINRYCTIFPLLVQCVLIR